MNADNCIGEGRKDVIRIIAPEDAAGRRVLVAGRVGVVAKCCLGV